ncbi:MAG: hypothetical protein HY684_06320 [Chloroflexi bacterium]|nr:hypothetical protein [Chloroflexota bacterium]
MSFWGTLFGLFFLAVGTLWLLNTLGVISLRAGDLWSIAAPLFLVLIGLAMLVRGATRQRRS